MTAVPGCDDAFMSDSAPAVPRPVRLGPDDAGELMTLQRAAYVPQAQLHDELFLPPLTETLDEVRAALAAPGMTALGLREGGRLLAGVRLHVPDDASVAELGRLAVAPDRQGEGLGTRLLLAAERAVPPSVRRIRLFTGEHSTDNLRLYARFGYREVGRTRMRTHEQITLEKVLDRSP